MTKTVTIITEVTNVYQIVTAKVPDDYTTDKIKEAFNDCDPFIEVIDSEYDFDNAEYLPITIEDNGE